MNRAIYPFAAIVGQTPVLTALTLAAVDPQLGGVLIQGPRGMAKSTAARALADLLPQAPFVTLPLGASDERIVGSLDLEKVLADGSVSFRPGLLAQAHEGVLYIDEVNLLADALVDVVLDVAASGVNVVERDAVSHRHPARFVLVGTMNPEEGELRPQLLDRFGLCVMIDGALDADTRQQIVQRRMAFDLDPVGFRGLWDAAQSQLRARIVDARERLAAVHVGEALRRQVAETCAAAGADGVRGDLSLLRAARAYAAWAGRGAVDGADIDAVVELALCHRRRHPAADSPPRQSPPPPQSGAAQDGGNGHWGELPPVAVAPVGAHAAVDTAKKAWPVA